MTDGHHSDQPGSRPGAFVRRAARTATSPVRDYLNDHFEMVKEEIRRNAAAAPAVESENATQVTSDDAWARVAELENLLAEQAVHQARVMARVGDELAALTDRVAELEALLRTVVDIVAAPASDPAS